MKKSLLRLAALSLVAVATVALASVTFDPATGIGFVGKGDVQSAFGWNNAAAQQHTNEVSFVFEGTTSYSVTCEFDTPHTHHVQVHHQTSVNSAYVDYVARMKNQYTGYNLTGYGATTQSDGPVPVVGAGCPGNSGLGQVTAVEIDAAGDASGQALYVVWSGQSHKIWPADPVPVL